MTFFTGKIDGEANLTVTRKRHVLVADADTNTLELWIDGVEVDTIALQDYHLTHTRTGLRLDAVNL